MDSHQDFSVWDFHFVMKNNEIVTLGICFVYDDTHEETFSIVKDVITSYGGQGTI